MQKKHLVYYIHLNCSNMCKMKSIVESFHVYVHIVESFHILCFMWRIKIEEWRKKQERQYGKVTCYNIRLYPILSYISTPIHINILTPTQWISSQKISELDTGNQALLEKLLGLEKSIQQKLNNKLAEINWNDRMR